MRFLALDIGDVRIGIAVCDLLETAAFPVRTIRRVQSLKRDVAAVLEVVAEQEVDAVVAGLPVSLDGGVGPQAQKVLGFVRALARGAGVPVVTWDESLTSVDADTWLIGRGMSRQKRRETIDQMAAVLILDSYLDHRRRTGASRDAVECRKEELGNRS
ncbi:MAG: Holliday junction resolvase RuvX [Capsulimonadaceae bacterium]